MAAQLSAYELERLANVARNQAVLDALGLGGDNTLKKKKPPIKKPPAPKPDDDDDVSKFVRRSGRSTNAPATYSEGLSDAFMCKEERALERRELQSYHPQRKRSAPTYHSDEQGDAISARNEANAVKRRRHEAELERQNQQQQQRAALIVRASNLPMLPSMSTAQAAPPFVHVAASVTVNKPWRVDQPVVKCMRCGGLYAQRKDGRVRDHYCSPTNSTVAPVLAHLPAM